MAPPRTGTRGSISEAQSSALYDRERPHRAEHEASTGRRDRGTMPKTLGQLLTWFAGEWDPEIPTRIHTVEVYHARQERDRDGAKVWPEALVGGSALGAPALTDHFRRYMESYAGEQDADGYYLRPMHAALARLAARDHWMARNLWAVAQAGYDWRGVADRGHWVHGMYVVYIEEALRRLWREHSERAVRLG